MCVVYDLSGVFIIDKNVEIHTVRTIVSWTNPKQWQMVHNSDLMMMIT